MGDGRPTSQEARPLQSRAWSLVALAWGGLFLSLLELIRVLALDELPDEEPGPYALVLGGAAVILLVWALHAVPVTLICRALAKVLRRPWLPWAVGAGLFGLSLQETVMHGDGIVSHPAYWILRPTVLVAVPLGLAAAVWALWSDRVRLRLRRAVAVLVLVAGTIGHLLLLPTYQELHGHLAAFDGALFLWLTWPLWQHRIAHGIAIAVTLATLIAAVAVTPGHVETRAAVQRFTHTGGSMLLGLPFARPLVIGPDTVFFLGEEPTPDQLAQFDLMFGDPVRFAEGEPRGRNVLLVVLETVRGDYWAEPELTPEFHRWKRRGTYVPDAVSQYPATPLAYGAMFASQPPSILAQTPYWGQSRLFDRIRDRFDRLILTRPDNEWFDHTAITDFFVPRNEPVHEHRSGPEALAHLRQKIAAARGRSFFAWAHLYEPHGPYQARPGFTRGGGRRAAYRSEIAYTDHHLGRFMDWFLEQSAADDTLIIVVGDHGEGMGERILGRPYWGHHVHVHNVVSRVPAFFAGPDIPADRTERGLGVMQLDVMPTIYDFLGAPLPREHYPQGLSFYDVLERRPERPLVTEAFSIRGKAFFDFVAQAQHGQDLAGLRERFHQISTSGRHYAPKIALQYGRHKVVYDRVLRRHWLYDVEQDPQERVDLASRRPELRAAMVAHLEDWMRMQTILLRHLDALHAPAP